MGPETKNRRGFFLLRSKATNTQKLTLDIQKFLNDPLTHGGNLDPIWAQQIIFGLIFQ